MTDFCYAEFRKLENELSNELNELSALTPQKIKLMVSGETMRC